MSNAARAFKSTLVTATAAALLTGIAASCAPSALADSAMQTATTAVNIRSGASTSARVLAVLRSGQRIEATGPSVNGWTPVKYNGAAAYVFSRYLRGPAASAPAPKPTPKPTITPSKAPTTAPPPAAAPDKSMVTTDELNVRSGPSTGYGIVGVLPKGATVTITGKSYGNWAEVSYNGQLLWVSTGYLALPGTPNVQVTGKGVTTCTAYIRLTSASSFVWLGIMPIGTQVDLTANKQNGVTQIVYLEQVRWINSSCVAPVAPAPGPAPLPVPGSTGVAYAASTTVARSTPEADGTVVGTIYKGATVPVTGVAQGSWTQVVWDGAKRWVWTTSLTTTKPAVDYGDSSGLTNLKPAAKGVVAVVRARFPQIHTIYGTRSDPLPDHPTGHAVDLMIPSYRTNTALGYEMAAYFKAHAVELKIQYIIFRQHIWNIARDAEGWRLMGDRGGDTANHMDHLHITVHD